MDKVCDSFLGDVMLAHERLHDFRDGDGEGSNWPEIILATHLFTMAYALCNVYLAKKNGICHAQ